MRPEVKPGKYVAAVSGGVDSVVLLDLLVKTLKLEIIVAHYDHGIRPDSHLDKNLVEEQARKYGCIFETERVELGAGASEELARKYRYEFLNRVKEKYGADGIITAHHKDDVIETACINLLRGTYRKGVSSLESGVIIRPLLNYSKAEIVGYAKTNGLYWREDETNSDQRYLRNFIRSKLADAPAHEKDKFYKAVLRIGELNHEINEAVESIFEAIHNPGECEIDRKAFIGLPYAASCEIIAYWMSQNGLEYDRKNIEILCVQFKTGRSGSRADAGKGAYFLLERHHIRFNAG